MLSAGGLHGRLHVCLVLWSMKSGIAGKVCHGEVVQLQQVTGQVTSHLPYIYR